MQGKLAGVRFLVAALSLCSSGWAADLKTGDQCSLSAEGDDVFISVDEKTHDRLLQLCNAKDETGVAQLVALGKVAVIKAGTRAKIIDRGFLVSEIRILEGSHAGESGFVASDFMAVAPAKFTPAEQPKPAPSQVKPVKTIPAANHVAHFANGSIRAVLSYRDEGESYFIEFSTGGKGRYPKKMVKELESIADHDSTTPRLWTDAAGKHKLEASFLSLKNGVVMLKKKDGSNLDIQMEQLSDADQSIVNGMVKVKSNPNTKKK